MADVQRSFRLYVTHVDSDGPYLKICGQLAEQSASACVVESLIESSREYFEQGFGAATATTAIREGIICAAKYKDGNYYRVKIISVSSLASGLVGVQLIDYGNKDVISLSTIRFLDNFDPILLQLPGQVTDYHLTRIIQPTRWEAQQILELQSLLCYSEYLATIEALTCTIPIISVLYQGNDLSQYLVSLYGMDESVQALPRSWPNTFAPHVNHYTDHVPFFPNQYFPSNPASAMHLQQNVSIPHSAGYVAPPCTISLKAPLRQPATASPNPVTTPPAQMPTTPIKLGSPEQAITTYKSKLLEVDSQYNVFVSHVEEGPELFAVHLFSEGQKFVYMTNEINRLPQRSLTEPPMIGTVCLGRMSGDHNIYRAIVVNVYGQQCNLFFVDVGNTQMVSYYDIFHIPEKFVTPNMFAITFCLSKVKTLPKGQHLTEAFKQLVIAKKLTLRVVAPEGPPLIQYGELYSDNKNILDMLMTTIYETLQFKWCEPLDRDSKHSVIVCYVDSCVKFFVQRSDQIGKLNAVMEAVKSHCERTSSPGQLPVGAACCARFPDDDNWFRARVLEVNGSETMVAYVDYGNEHVAADLRTITEELMQLPAQALKCALKDFEDKPDDENTSKELERLTLGKTLMAHMMDVLSGDTMLVTLVNEMVKPPRNVATMLLLRSRPRSINVPKATTPVRKDAPEAFSSPEGSQPEDKSKPFRRETSFMDDRRGANSSREREDFAQRGGSFHGSLVTTLCSRTTGEKLAIFTPDEDAHPSETPLRAHIHDLGWCAIAHAASLADMWLLRGEDADIIFRLLYDLFKFYEEGAPEPLESFEAGALCAAKYSDGNWYRATVTASTDADITVHFTDYGNSETVAKDAVKKLDSKFNVIRPLAYRISLGLVALTDDALDKLQEWIGENEVQVTLSYGFDGWLAHLHLDGVDLSVKLMNEKLATPQVDAQEEVAETMAKAPEGCTQMYISHIDSPGLFWLQMSDKIDAIEAIQEQLQANAVLYENLENRETGIVCVAKYLTDEQWYRAEILDSDADITTVRYIDYGNTAVLDNKPGLLKVIPEALNTERLAVKASVNAVPTGTEQWSEPASEHFTQLVGDLPVPVDARIVLKDDDHDTTYLDVFVDGHNLTDKLVVDGHATRSEETECGYDLPSCFASHVNTPSSLEKVDVPETTDETVVAPESTGAKEDDPVTTIEKVHAPETTGENVDEPETLVEKEDAPETTVETVDAPEAIVEATDANPTELETSRNESVDSNHAVNKSFEADVDSLDKNVSEASDEGFKCAAPHSPENDSIVDTLESSNETIKTPEKEADETVKTPERDTNTGYTSEGDHDKSPVKESLENESPKPEEEAGEKN